MAIEELCAGAEQQGRRKDLAILTPSEDINLAYRLQRYCALTANQRAYVRHLEDRRNGIYSSPAKAWEPLTLEQEIELGKKIKSGDKEATDILILWNVRLAVSTALAYPCRKASQDDIVQEAYIGLMKAVHSYDPKKINPETGVPYRFSTYATWSINRCIMRYLDNKGLITSKRYHPLLIRKIMKARDKLIQEHFREPSSQEIADILNNNGVQHTLKRKNPHPFSPEDIEKLLDIDYKQHRVVSLDKIIGYNGGGPSYFMELVADDRVIGQDELAMAAEERGILKRRIRSNLTSFEAEVIKSRLGINGNGSKTLKEAGRVLGITKQRMHQIETVAIGKLKSGSG